MREMKDSGVKWVGEIPSSWKVYKVKQIANSNSEVLPENYDEEQEIDYIEIGSVTYEHGVRTTEKMKFGNAPSRARRIVHNGDTIISTVRTYLKAIAYIDDSLADKIVSTGFSVVTPHKDVVAKFLYYALSTHSFISNVEAHSVGISYPAINNINLMDLKIVLPMQCEQIQIASYLNSKCSKIDGIIEKQQAIIEKLKEYKLSVITETVTKGLNPNAEMKDSGNIEIGKIPSISRPTKLKYLCNTQGRIGFKGYTKNDLVDEGEGAYTLGASHLNNGKIDLTDPVFISWEKYYESPEIMVKQNDILIVQRGSIGKVAIVDKNYGEVTINPSLVLINKIHIDSKYLLYALSARYIVNYINLIGTTTAIPMISQKKINDLVIIVPPDSIQISVVKYLDEKCGKIDANILKKQKLIEKLQEYKKSLIYEVVTGKKEV